MPNSSMAAVGAIAALGAWALVAWRSRAGHLRRSRLNFDSELQPQLSDADLSFLMRYRAKAGAENLNPDALRAHVVAVWLENKKAAHVYRCIQSMSFLKARGALHPKYVEMLDNVLGKGGKVVDVGCCYGQDSRALLLDGVAPEHILAVDVTDVYWAAGLRLFGDEPLGAASPLASAQTRFVDFAAPADSEAGQRAEAGLARQFSGALCMFVLHVLSREQSSALLARIARCSQPGGMLIGACVGSAVEVEWARTPDGKYPRFLHSVASLRAALQLAGWGAISVDEAEPGGWEEGSGAGAMPTTGRGERTVRLLFSARAL